MQFAERVTYLFAVLLALTVWVAAIYPRETAATTAEPSPALRVAALSNGWPIKMFLLNNSGSVFFAGGQNPFGADGFVLVNQDRFLKFAAYGDPAPGFEGEIFVGFSSQNDRLALNDRDEIIFTAACMACRGASSVWECLDRSVPIHHALFRYAGGRIDKVVATGDTAPGTAGLSYFRNIWLNNRGTVLFMADIAATDPQQPPNTGLFSISEGRIEKILSREELSHLGGDFTDPTPILFDDKGVITFIRSYGIFRFVEGKLIKVIARGDPAPGGGVFEDFVSGVDSDANMQGDIAFQARFGPSLSESGLFLLHNEGTITRILAHGDPNPLGGTFTLWFETPTRGGTFAAPFRLDPRLNESGHVIFRAPVPGKSVTQALFLYTQGRIEKMVALGDSAPGGESFDSLDTRYTLNDLDTVAFTSHLTNGLTGLFQRAHGQITKLAIPGDTAPGTDGSTIAKNQGPCLLNDSGDVAFQSNLCCGSWTEGIFLSSPSRPAIPNGDFELAGDGGRPTGWQAVWNVSGSGTAFRYTGSNADAFHGDSVLRLHVDPGGGSTFVLSDSIPVAADTVYLIDSQLRYYLASDSDAVFFSLIQFDAADNIVGFDEKRGRKGENYWTWQRKVLSVRTALNARSVRIRLGLSTSGESYLDVDNVR